jgi:crossover junction endodeoxyribonuclease RusA
MKITLPYPPSLNSYYRSYKGRVVISSDGKNYRTIVFALSRGFSSLGSKRLAVSVFANPPDKRKRDLDNLLKSLLDALEHAGLFDDDSQIDCLKIFRGKPIKDGQVIVSIREKR